MPLLSGSVPEASEDVIGMSFDAIDREGDKDDVIWRNEVNSLNIEEIDFDMSRDYMKDIIEMLDQSNIKWAQQVDFIIGLKL